MIKSNFLQKLAAELSAALPTHAATLKDDFEKSCQTILNKTFTKFDLVSREEFVTQTKVLAKTRQKLEELEKKLQALEAELNQQSKE